MKSISGYSISDAVSDVDLLEGLDKFIEDRIKANDNFLKNNDLLSIDTREILPNIINSNKFTFSSSIYGDRHGFNQAIKWKIRKEHPDDCYITDAQGFLKNNDYNLDTKDRILYAKKNKLPVIFMFGGSTMMSIGAITPYFSIPSLVEDILRIKYGKDVVCVNYAIGGTCSREALDLYVHDAIELMDSANVVFYDGWNCADYLTKTHMMCLSKFFDNSNLVSAGDTERTIKHNIILSKTYDLGWHLKQSLNLLVAYIFLTLSKILPKKFKTLFSIIQKKIFPLSAIYEVNKLTSNLDISNQSIKLSINKAVSQYINIHKSVKAICDTNNSKFIWVQQPLVYWGNKPLTNNESQYKMNNYNIDGRMILEEFEKEFNTKFKKKLDNKLSDSFHDLTGLFDTIKKELYIDSGHLNQLGSTIISAKLANVIFNSKNFLK